MSYTERVAVNYLSHDESGRIFDERTGQLFDRTSYSMMKYGDRTATVGFAHDVAHTLIDHVPQLVERDTPPELLVAYKAVPPACFYLSRYCLDIINDERARLENEPGRVVQVYKSHVATTNYAAASSEARQRELDSIDFSLEGRDVTAKDIVVLDDIRITGAAEQSIVDILKSANPRLLTLGYIAIYNAQQAALHPGVENELNASVVTNISDLLPFIKADNFDLNIRTVKMLLKSDMPEFEQFLAECPLALRAEIYRGVIGTGGDFREQYKGHIAILRNSLQSGATV